MPPRRNSRSATSPTAGRLNHDRAQELLLQLLRIPGPSGRESEVARFITERLREAGLPADAMRTDAAHRRSPHPGEIGNLICRLPGTQRGSRRLLMAHMDTVPLCVGAEPVVHQRRVVPASRNTALGADNRAGVAVVLTAAIEILTRRLPHPPLSFLWTVQEELGLHGARYGSLGWLGRPLLAFNFDGGAPTKLTVAATGGYRMTIDIHGLASHAGGAPERGVSAIAIAALAIADLQREGWHGLIEKGGKRGTSNIGVICGGEATNVVTPHVQLRAEARSHDPGFRRRIVKRMEEAFRRASRAVRNNEQRAGRVEIDGRLDYEAFKLPASDPSIVAAETAIRDLGLEPMRAATNGGLDANWMTARGIPTVTLGCGSNNPHTTDEWLDLDQFHQACEIAVRLATGDQ